MKYRLGDKFWFGGFGGVLIEIAFLYPGGGIKFVLCDNTDLYFFMPERILEEMWQRGVIRWDT